MSDGTLPVKVHLSDEEHFVWSLISSSLCRRPMTARRSYSGISLKRGISC